MAHNINYEKSYQIIVNVLSIYKIEKDLYYIRMGNIYNVDSKDLNIVKQKINIKKLIQTRNNFSKLIQITYKNKKYKYRIYMKDYRKINDKCEYYIQGK